MRQVRRLLAYLASMRTPYQNACSVVGAMLLAVGCDRHSGDSATSVTDARKRGLLVAEYSVPANADLDRYRVLEVWAETVPSLGNTQLVVRLQGPHHGGTHRVQIVGLDEADYRGIWSERGGPPYERWNPPQPLPATLLLTREGRQGQVQRR